MTFFAFDTERLSTLQENTGLFSYNSFGPLSLHDRYYLHGKELPIGQQLDRFLPALKPGQHSLLVTSPRYFGYAFNPVNFHLRMDGETLIGAVAEVNNTFGDRHVYPLTKLDQIGTNTWTAECNKDFHVSPFNSLEGQYHFTFIISPESLYLAVDLYRSGVCIMKTWIEGSRSPISNAAICKYALLHPFDTALNSMPRILWQAAILYLRRHMPVNKRPKPVSPDTLVERDNPIHESNVI